MLLAATDTTSTAITRAIEALAHRPEVQSKLREELLDATARTGRTLAEFDYDAYTSLPYLEAVVRETIRMYPSFYVSPRVCVSMYHFPLCDADPSHVALLFPGRNKTRSFHLAPLSKVQTDKL